MKERETEEQTNKNRWRYRVMERWGREGLGGRNRKIKKKRKKEKEKRREIGKKEAKNLPGERDSDPFPFRKFRTVVKFELQAEILASIARQATFRIIILLCSSPVSRTFSS